MTFSQTQWLELKTTEFLDRLKWSMKLIGNTPSKTKNQIQFKIWGLAFLLAKLYFKYFPFCKCQCQTIYNISHLYMFGWKIFQWIAFIHFHLYVYIHCLNIPLAFTLYDQCFGKSNCHATDKGIQTIKHQTNQTNNI